MAPGIQARRLGRRWNTLLAAALIALSPAGASAQTKLRVGKAQALTFTFFPADVGLHAGIYKKHGLDIDLASYGGDAKMAQGVVAGSLDIVLAAGPTLTFVSKGTPMKGVAAISGPPATIMLVVAKNGPVKTEADLKGRSVSFSNVGSLSNWVGLELMRLNGWAPGTIKLVPLGASEAQIAALKTGQIDGVITDSGTVFRLEEDGFGHTVVRFGERVPHFLANAIYASNSMIEKQPDSVRKFLLAWLESVRFMRERKAETVDIIVKHVGMPKSVAERNYDLIMPIISTSGRFEDKALDVLARSFVELSIMPQKPDLKPMLTEAFLPN